MRNRIGGEGRTTALSPLGAGGGWGRTRPASPRQVPVEIRAAPAAAAAAAVISDSQTLHYITRRDARSRHAVGSATPEGCKAELT